RNREPPNLRRQARVAVVTTTGGGAAAVVDRLGLAGIELSGMHDLTMAGTAQDYRATLEHLLASADCDAVLAAVGSSAQFHPEFAVEPILTARHTAKPLVAFLTPHAERSIALLAEHGVPAVRTPEACADSLAAFFAWRAPREIGVRALFNSLIAQTCVPDLIRAPAPNSFAVLEALGIPVVDQPIAQAPQYAHALSYPVALKRLGVAHKTEQGGVVLNIGDGAELAQQARRMGDERLLVQRMESGLAEAIVGYRDDPVVGPLVLVGAGGTLAELYQDVAVALAPVDEAEALAMIERVKGLAIVRGYRNLPRGDIAALARAVAALSRLALIPGRPVREAEANPVIVKRDGVVAVATVARVCPRSADVVQAGNFGPIRVLAEYGSAAQKEKHLRRLLAGEAVISVGMTEPEAGSAVTDLKTSATRDGEGWRINGSKIFTTHSAYAEVFLVYVRYAPGIGGIGSVLVDKKDVRLGRAPGSCRARNGRRS